MPKLIWAVLCKRILVDKDTNSVSFIDLVDGLGARELPAGLPQLYVGTEWAREVEGERLKVRFRLLPPGGKNPIVSYETEEIKLKPRHRINLNLQGAQTKAPGEYTVTVDYWASSRYRTLARIPLLISLIEPSED